MLHKQAVLAVAVVLVALTALGVGSLLTAPPAGAYLAWQHDGAVVCEACHMAGEVRDGACEFCHGGYETTGTESCWSCHKPGQDMSAYQTSAGCSAVCHVRRPNANIYDVVFTHGAAPHDGADYAPCLTCHGVSVSFNDPDDSPHHDGVVQPSPTCQQCHDGGLASAVVNHDSVDPPCESCHTGMNIPAQPAVCNQCHAATTFGTGVCTDCHSPSGVMGVETVHTATPTVSACNDCHAGYQKHAGKKTCQTCHTKATTFHHAVTTSAGSKKCIACHSKNHAGKKVAGSKCATCHKGNAPPTKPRAQHSVRITSNKGKCGACHSKRVHASAEGGKLSCRTCHRTRFHARQSIPGSTVCSNCHGRLSHASGYSCLTCHRGVVHDPTPSGGSVVGR